MTLFFCFTVLFFCPLQVYYGNWAEFDYLFIDLLPFLLILVAVVALPLILFLRLSAGLVHEKALALVFALAFLFWFQATMLVWDYGVPYGETIEWSRYVWNGYIDTALWVLIIGTALVYSALIRKHAFRLSILFLVLQSIAAVVVAYSPRGDLSFKRYKLDETNKFFFSGTKNVIIIVCDSFQSDIFQEIINEDKSYGDIFDGFRYFPNALSGYTQTVLSIPHMLTGAFYDNSLSRYDHINRVFLENSLPKTLQQNGYRSEIYISSFNGRDTIAYSPECFSNLRRRVEPFVVSPRHTILMEISFFRQLPHFAKILLYENGSGANPGGFLEKSPQRGAPTESDTEGFMETIAKENNRFLPFFKPHVLKKILYHKLGDAKLVIDMFSKAKITTQEPVFKFFHFSLPHPPIVINERLEAVKERAFNRKSFKSQSKAALKFVAVFLHTLKARGIYDRSLVFIVSDHGSGQTPDLFIDPTAATESYYPVLDPENNFQKHKAQSVPLVLIKSFNARGPLTVSGAPVSLGDIPRTAVSLLGIEASFPGSNMFALDETAQRKRTNYFHYRENAYYSYAYLVEYEVSGDSWRDEAWRPTYRYFTPRGLRYYAPGEKLKKASKR